MDQMIHNSYVALLDQDKITIKHPTNDSRQVTLYRICALKTFKLPAFDIVIEKNTVGGYVQGLHNLDPEAPSWVGHRSRVFDDAKILHGSLLTESCVVFGNAEIRASRLKHYARVLDDAQIIESTLENLVEVKGSATVLKSTMCNSTMVFNNASIQDSSLKIGSCVRGNAIVLNTTLTDTTQIGGDARVVDCKLSNDAKIFDGKHEGKTFNVSQDLIYETFDGNLNDLKPVSFQFSGTDYSGYAWHIPGKSRSLVYRDKAGKHVLKTRNSMNLSITSKQLYDTDTF
tara:strand:+ start:2349 stop:3206 length:858 start_codon:yes stop_codon:yes gene_type:complete